MFQKYNAFVAERKEKATPETHVSNSDSLLDFAGANVGKGDGDMPKNDTVKHNVIDELGDIFSADGDAGSIAEPLKPVSLMPSGTYKKSISVLDFSSNYFD